MLEGITDSKAGSLRASARTAEQAPARLRMVDIQRQDDELDVSEEAGFGRLRTRTGRLKGVIAGLVALDASLIVLAMVAAWLLRELVPNVPQAASGGMVLAAWAAPWILLTWLVLLLLNGTYSRRLIWTGTEEFRNSVQAAVVTGLLISTGAYFAESELSRGFLVGTFVIGGMMILLARYAVRKWVHRRRIAGEMRERVLIVGSGGAINEVAGMLSRAEHLGYEITACTLPEWAQESDEELPAPEVGTVHTLPAVCDKLNISTVMVAGGADVNLREIAWKLEGRDIDLVVVPRLADVAGTRLHMRPVAGLPMLHVEEPQASQAGDWPKRVFDIFGAIATLLVLSPVFLVVAALIKLDDGGPVFYRQDRIGLNGDRFKCWKFRSMSVDADKIDAQLRVEHGHTEGLFKLQRDPRVTRIGRFIRRFSIDELPQLFNVVEGTMSLVGPRPHLPVEVETYDDRVRRRLHVRPGMTGLWQVSGRSNLSWDDSVRLDLYYRDNWSMVGDFIIMAKTVRAVLTRDGAY